VPCNEYYHRFPRITQTKACHFLSPEKYIHVYFLLTYHGGEEEAMDNETNHDTLLKRLDELQLIVYLLSSVYDFLFPCCLSTPANAVDDKYICSWAREMAGTVLPNRPPILSYLIDISVPIG
jgi:hypothetical protein